MSKTNTTCLLLTICFVSSSMQAGELTIPNTFQADNTAVAKDVNDNFIAVKKEIDNNHLRIQTLENNPDWLVQGNSIYPANGHNLSLGTTISKALLTIYDNDSCSNCGGIKLISASSIQGAGLSLANNVLYVHGDQNKDVHLGTSTQIRLAANGNIGIGNFSPGFKLDVAGGDINIANGGYRSAGTCVVGTCASDARLKRGVKPLSDSLNKIALLRPVSYEYKDKSHGDGKQYGLIAQEVEKVFPEWVVEPDNGHKSIQYGLQIQMHLINAVKELQKQNRSLARKIRLLEAKM